jgi:hypothetical protein
MIRPKSPRMAAKISIVRILTKLASVSGDLRDVALSRLTVLDPQHQPALRYCR